MNTNDTPATTGAHTPVSDAALAQALYGTKEVTDAIESRHTELYEVRGDGDAQRAELASTFTEIAKSLPVTLTAKLATNYIDAELAEARADDPAVHAAAVDKTITEANRLMRTGLAQTYGVKGAEDLIARTNRFIAASPQLSKVLGKYGLGSRPDLVEDIVHHVYMNGLGR
jgi:hypothetical protein